MCCGIIIYHGNEEVGYLRKIDNEIYNTVRISTQLFLFLYITANLLEGSKLKQNKNKQKGDQSYWSYSQWIKLP